MADKAAFDELKKGHSDVQVEDVILQRWSPRAFSEASVSDEQLKQIFTAASWAASSYNEQPWRFIVGRKGDETWEKIFATLLPFNQSWAKPAHVLYAAFAKRSFTLTQLPNASYVHDLGAASAMASLQATALGLYTHGMRGFNGEMLSKAFAVPDDFEPVACWALGHFGEPATLPENFKTMEDAPRIRKPLSELVFRQWDQAAL